MTDFKSILQTMNLNSNACAECRCHESQLAVRVGWLAGWLVGCQLSSDLDAVLGHWFLFCDGSLLLLACVHEGPQASPELNLLLHHKTVLWISQAHLVLAAGWVHHGLSSDPDAVFKHQLLFHNGFLLLFHLQVRRPTGKPRSESLASPDCFWILVQTEPTCQL